MSPEDTEERGRKRTRLTYETLTEHDRATDLHCSLSRSPGSNPSTLRSGQGRRSKLIPATDPRFNERLHKNFIFAFPSEPKNISDAKVLTERLNISRDDSPSPTRSEYEAYVATYSIVPGKTAVSLDLWSSFGKAAKHPYVTDQAAWKMFRDESNGRRNVCWGLSAPKPDLADYRTMRDEAYPETATALLHSILEPCGTGISYAMPHFFVEFTGPLASIETAKDRAAYVGACIGRSDALAHDPARRSLASPHIHAISVRFNGSEMQIDGHYMDPCDWTRGEYFMHKLAAFSVTESFEEYQSAIRAVRNAQDIGREMTEEILDLLVSRG